jgi:hypothetical protein
VLPLTYEKTMKPLKTLPIATFHGGVKHSPRPSNVLPLLRVPRDLKIEAAAKTLATHTGESPEKWTRILRWRVKHFRGNLGKALRAFDADSRETVFEPGT